MPRATTAYGESIHSSTSASRYGQPGGFGISTDETMPVSGKSPSRRQAATSDAAELPPCDRIRHIA